MSLKAFLASVAICLAVFVAPQPMAAASSSQRAPGFDLQTLNGKDVRLSDLKGKVVLLDFWASWCAPCVAGLPQLLKLNDGAARNGIVIVGVTLDYADTAVKDAGERKLKAFVADHSMNFPVVQMNERFNSDYGKILGLKGGRVVGRNGMIIANLPSWILIDRRGFVRAVFSSSADESRAIHETLTAAR